MIDLRTKRSIIKLLKQNRHTEIQKDIKEQKAYELMRRQYLARFFKNFKLKTL